jgi:hypothetical protein
VSRTVRCVLAFAMMLLVVTENNTTAIVATADAAVDHVLSWTGARAVPSLRGRSGRRARVPPRMPLVHADRVNEGRVAWPVLLHLHSVLPRHSRCHEVTSAFRFNLFYGFSRYPLWMDAWIGGGSWITTGSPKP